jgi:hypothetical protein
MAAYDRPTAGIEGTFEAAFIPTGHAMNGNESVVAIREDGSMVGPPKCVSLDAATSTYVFEQIKVTRSLDCVTDVERILGPSDNNPNAQALIAQCEANNNTDRSLQVLSPGQYEGYQFVMYDPDGGGRYFKVDDGIGGLFPANNADIDFLRDAIALPERDPVELAIPAQSFPSLAAVVSVPVVCVIPADMAAYDRPTAGIEGTFEAAFIPQGHVMNGNESVVAIRGDGRMVGPAKCVSLDAATGAYFFEQIKVTRSLDCVTDVERILGPSANNPNAQALIAQCQAGNNTDRSLQVLSPGEYEGYQFVMYDPDEGGRYFRIDDGAGGLFPANNADIDFLRDAIALPERDPVGLQVPSDFSGSLAESALPVELISFSGTTSAGGMAELEWATATETENDYFEVQRSHDGLTFRVIGRVAGAGDSRTVRRYSFRDGLVAAGPTYYRLRQVDFDGSFAFSEVISVDPGSVEGGGLRVFPNPTDGAIDLVLAAATNERTVRLYDPMSRQLREWTVGSDQTQLRIDISDLANGSYFLRTIGSPNDEIVPVIKR